MSIVVDISVLRVLKHCERLVSVGRAAAEAFSYFNLSLSFLRGFVEIPDYRLSFVSAIISVLVTECPVSDTNGCIINNRGNVTFKHLQA